MRVTLQWYSCAKMPVHGAFVNASVSATQQFSNLKMNFEFNIADETIGSSRIINSHVVLLLEAVTVTFQSLTKLIDSPILF